LLNLVTGGTGFLGSHLVDALVSRGDDVIIVDNLLTGNIRNIEAALETGRATFLYADIGQPQTALDQLLKAVTAGRSISRIYHLVSTVNSDGVDVPGDALTLNSIGTMSLIEISLRHGARFLYAATSEFYGFPEPGLSSGKVDSTEERARYDEGNLFGEVSVSVAVRSRGLNGGLVRFFGCYGPRMTAANGRLIPALHEAAFSNAPFYLHGTGLQTLSMTFVDDAIRLLLRVMDHPKAFLQPVNIGNDEALTVLQIVETFARVAGVSLDVRFATPHEVGSQSSRPEFTVARSLGWSPTVSLEDGLRRTIDWMRSVSLNYV
jgi:dTDP-glucose 4,6-dehydratase